MGLSGIRGRGSGNFTFMRGCGFFKKWVRFSRQSLSVLKHASSHSVTKTSIMLGLGESDAEVMETMEGNFN